MFNKKLFKEIDIIYEKLKEIDMENFKDSTAYMADLKVFTNEEIFKKLATAFQITQEAKVVANDWIELVNYLAREDAYLRGKADNQEKLIKDLVFEKKVNL